MGERLDTNHQCYNLRQPNRISHKISKPTITVTDTTKFQRSRSHLFRLQEFQVLRESPEPTRYVVDNDADFRQLVQKLTGATPPVHSDKDWLAAEFTANCGSQLPSDCSAKSTEQKPDQTQERLTDAIETAVPVMDCGSEISSEPELVSANGLHFRVDEVSSVDPVATDSQELTSTLNGGGKLNGNPQESLLGSESEKTSQEQMSPDNTIEHDHRKLLEDDLKSQLLGDMSCSSFHDMLANLEQMITEVGGDLTL